MAEKLTDEEIKKFRDIVVKVSKLEKIIGQVEKIETLLVHIDQIEAEMKYKAARRLVWKAGRTFVIGIASIIVALAVTWDKVAAFGHWVFR